MGSKHILCLIQGSLFPGFSVSQDIFFFYIGSKWIIFPMIALLACSFACSQPPSYILNWIKTLVWWGWYLFSMALSIQQVPMFTKFHLAKVIISLSFYCIAWTENEYHSRLLMSYFSFYHFCLLWNQFHWTVKDLPESKESLDLPHVGTPQ